MCARILAKYTDEYSITIAADSVAVKVEVEDENGNDSIYLCFRPN